MQNGLENVFFTMCLVAFACVGATHFSIRIFAKHVVGDESWCVWGVVFVVVGGHFCIVSPIGLARFVRKLALLVFSVCAGFLVISP